MRLGATMGEGDSVGFRGDPPGVPKSDGLRSRAAEEIPDADPPSQQGEVQAAVRHSRKMRRTLILRGWRTVVESEPEAFFCHGSVT